MRSARDRIPLLINRFASPGKMSAASTPSSSSSLSGRNNGQPAPRPFDGLRLPPINVAADRYPYCIVWTPIPVLTWFFPFIGHMGIALSSGVIRDFAGPYFVSEDSFAFGRPARYLRLNPAAQRRASTANYSTDWDECVSKASVVYGTRMHNLFCDNCHSHVGMALGLMEYDGRPASGWTMVRLAVWMFVYGQYVGWWGAVRTWLPFTLVVLLCGLAGVYL